MSAVSFSDWLAAWLDEVDAGLGAHAGVVTAYGARAIAHLDAFDADDINALTKNFGAAGVAPLQCKWIEKKLRARVADAKAAAKASNGGKKAAQPASRPTEAAQHKHARQREEESDSEEEEQEDDEDESGGEEEDGEESDDEEPIVKRRRAANVTARPRKWNGKADAASSAAAAAAGRGTIPGMFEKSGASSNWHGRGGQASAAAAERGTARPFEPAFRGA